MDRASPDGTGLLPPPTESHPPALSRRVILLFATACGLSVANIYFAHPLLDAMARDLAIRPAVIGIVITATQVGYGLGLIFIAPLGDLLDRRRLIVVQAALSALALVVVGLAQSSLALLVGMVAVGLLAVAVQVLVAFAASLADDNERGRVVGIVTGGVVIGILLARFVAGVVADLGGWRAVYLGSAGVTLVMAALLFRTLPHRAPEAQSNSYPQLVGSVVTLFREEPILRARAILAGLIFACFNVLWAPLALPLSAPPFALSHSAIGMFGLAGLAGALGAGNAGRLADRGLGQWTTGLSLCLMLLAWLPIACMGASLWVLALGIIMLDLAIQAIHVTNQSLIFAVCPEARSRLVGGYMVFYSIGSAGGAIASTRIYASAGWPGVCGLGASVSTAALLFWMATRRSIRRNQARGGLAGKNK